MGSKKEVEDTERIKRRYRMIYGAELDDEELERRLKDLEGLEDLGINTKRIGPAPRLPSGPLH